MQCGVCYVQRCEQSGLCRCLRGDEQTGLGTSRRHHKLKFNLENCAFSLLVLYCCTFVFLYCIVLFIVVLSYFGIVLLYCCTFVLLYFCIFVLFYFIVVLLYCITMHGPKKSNQFHVSPPRNNSNYLSTNN